jgi:hypothetical protein
MVLKLKGSKWFAVWLAVLLGIFAANHIEYAWRSRANAARPSGDKIVIKEEQSLVGHRTIGVSEATLPGGGDMPFLRFGALGAWAFDPETPSPCPAVVQSLSGRTFSAVGFMYPLDSGVRVKNFCLLRSTQTCCYGPRPQYNQYILVNMKEPVKFERLAPVIVQGKFFAEAKPDDGYIYRMDGDTMVPAAKEEVQINATEAAQKEGLDLFSFLALEPLRRAAEETTAPVRVTPELLALNGKKMVLDGFLVGQSRDALEVLVGKYWWDGAVQGTPPDMYNAVKVFPKDDNELPPAWQQKVVFTGIVHVAADPADWPTQGIVSLHEAVKGVPGQGGGGVVFAPGPFLPVEDEALILAAFLAISFARYYHRAAAAPAQTLPQPPEEN